MGFDMDNTNANDFKIFGNGQGMLPIANNEPRHDDLVENATYAVGLDDGSFDKNDYILFYAQGPHKWERQGSLFSHRFNMYTDTAYYFVATNTGGGYAKRIQTLPDAGSTVTEVTSFDDRKFYDRDLFNLIKSGNVWYADRYDAQTEFNYRFDFPNAISSEPAYVKYSVAGRTVGASSVFTVFAGAESSQSSLSAVTPGYANLYARTATETFQFTPLTSTFDVKVSFLKGASNATGWLDYLELNVRTPVANERFANGISGYAVI